MHGSWARNEAKRRLRRLRRDGKAHWDWPLDMHGETHDEGIDGLVAFMSCGRISAAILDWLGIHAVFFGVVDAICNFGCF